MLAGYLWILQDDLVGRAPAQADSGPVQRQLIPTTSADLNLKYAK